MIWPIYDGQTGKIVATLSQRFSAITYAALSRDGAHGAAAILPPEIVTFDAGTGKVLQRHPLKKVVSARPLRIVVLQFTAAGDHVAFADNQGRLGRFAVTERRAASRLSSSRSWSRVRRPVFLPDGRAAVMGGIIDSDNFKLHILDRNSDRAPQSSESPTVSMPIALTSGSDISGTKSAFQSVSSQFIACRPHPQSNGAAMQSTICARMLPVSFRS